MSDYLRIECVQAILEFVIVCTGGHHGGEFEEDVGGHDIDPEHEGGEGVEGEIPNCDATKGTIWKQPSDTPAEVVAREANICHKVIEDKSDGNLSKQRPVQVRIN